MGWFSLKGETKGGERDGFKWIGEEMHGKIKG